MTCVKSAVTATAALALLGAAQSAVAATPAPAPAPKAAAAPAAKPVVVGKVPLPIKDATGKPMVGDLAGGAKIFVQCSVCHVITPGVNKVGPSLHGIIGRHSGSIPTFKYSAANKNSGITWTPQELFIYLENPQKRIPGTLMAFLGVKNPQQRADVIAYLVQNTK